MQRRREQREQEAYMQSLIQESPSAPDWEQLSPLLDDAMVQLRDQDRDALVLRYFQNKNLRDVGAALGVDEYAAQKRVSRALEKLRHFFAKRGVNSTAAAIGETISVNSVQAAPAALAKAVTAVALAKGAMASTSTLTLIKGALKIMAWTKTKTAIATGVVVLLGIGTATVIVESLLPAPDIQGTWIGTIPLSGMGVQAGESPKTRLVVEIVKKNGHYQASGANIDQGQNTPLDKFSYRHGSIHAEVTAAQVAFDGTVKAGGKAISGVYKEGQYSTRVNFTRTTNPPPFPEALTDAEFAPRADSVLQGFWKGIIPVSFRNGGLHINVKIAELADGTYRADFYSMDQGGGRQPTSVSYDGTTVKIMPMAGYGMFQGELRNGDRELVGDWIQGGQRMPTSFTRAN
jgi:hypothetical protein